MTIQQVVHDQKNFETAVFLLCLIGVVGGIFLFILMDDLANEHHPIGIAFFKVVWVLFKILLVLAAIAAAGGFLSSAFIVLVHILGL